MGNSKKNTQTGKGNSCYLGDITLNDFANVAISGISRLRKPVLNHQLDKHGTVGIADTWDAELRKKPTRRKKTNSECKENGSNVYPLDLWQAISRYIRPEDVGRFAGICHVSNSVVNSAPFWFNMYKRYYRPVKNMPERLQPECMTRLYELKSCVIRALYYMYPPFVSRYRTNKKKLSVLYHPSKTVSVYNPVLVKRRCISVWSKFENNHWQCNFIFKREDPSVARTIPKKPVPNLLTMLDDIYANKAEGCVMLQVIYRQYAVTPPVLGSILTSLNCDRNTLNMTFSAGISSSYNTTTVTFNSVEVVRTHNWWSPHYPHSNGFSPQAISCY